MWLRQCGLAMCKLLVYLENIKLVSSAILHATTYIYHLVFNCTRMSCWLSLVMSLTLCSGLFCMLLLQLSLYTTHVFKKVTHFVFFNHLSGQQQGQDGVKVQSSPVTVTVGNVASGSAMSPDQLGSVQSSSDLEGQPSKRLRRVACSCPNCRDGEGRYEYIRNTEQHAQMR